MSSNADIHAFAVKWLDEFLHTKTVIEEIETSAFSDECFALGFEMDCGRAFERAYPDVKAFTDYRELDKIIDDITDIPLLGSAVFSKWKSFTHCTDPSEDILSFMNRSWFITALGRLEYLTSDSDRIEKIAVDYHRITKVKPGVLPKGATWEYVTWDYSEQLTIDRKTETLEHTQSIGSGCQVSRKYHVENGITSLLDALNAQAFFAHTEGNPPDIICNPLETKDYRITIDYLNADQMVLTGSFDRYGLPDDFSEFAETTFEFMRFYGMGEILDPSVHDKALRKQSDFIFCNVKFDKYGKTYCYLTDDDTLKAEDYVIVPVGEDNHESIVRIESIEYHPAEEAPFPIDSIKKIIRKADRTEDSDDSIVVPEDTVVMASEPLVGTSADAWRAKLGEALTDEALATALAGAWNECGWLGHDLDDDDCTPLIEAAYEEWSALEQELIQKVASRINRKCETPYIKLITPFMEQNGYRNANGWWLKNNATNQHE